MSEIIFDKVTKIYCPDDSRSEVFALEDVSFQIKKGEFVFVIGESGAGKTTLLKLLTKQINPTSGIINVQGIQLDLLEGKDIALYRRKFGIMEREFGLLTDRSAFENIAIAMRATEQPRGEIKGKVNKALGIVGLKHKSESFPGQLSIGEAARIHLARAIVTNPEILVVDEPTANLDSGLAWDMMCLLDEINHQAGITVVVVSHARDLVSIMKKRVLTLVEGSLVADEKRAVYNSKALDIFEQRDVLNRRKIRQNMQKNEV